MAIKRNSLVITEIFEGTEHHTAVRMRLVTFNTRQEKEIRQCKAHFAKLMRIGVEIEFILLNAEMRKIIRLTRLLIYKRVVGYKIVL